LRWLRIRCRYRGCKAGENPILLQKSKSGTPATHEMANLAEPGGICLGLVGMLFGIWSPLRPGISLIGIAPVTAGYLLLLIVGFAQ
jgi:hypothetical protein